MPSHWVTTQAPVPGHLIASGQTWIPLPCRAISHSWLRLCVHLQDIASQLAHTPDIHALPTAEVQCEDRALEEAAAPGNAGHADDVAGLGTPQDFSSTVCNAGSPAGQYISLQDYASALLLSSDSQTR